MMGLDSLFDLATTKHVPVKSTIELLAPCNLNCIHCYVTHDKKNALTFEVVCSLLEQMQEAGGLYVSYTGGEIALRDDLLAIVKESRRRHFAVQLLSSGTLWGPHDWDDIAAANVHSVRLSVYGMTADVHDRVTQRPGSLGKTQATALGLLERGVSVAISAPILDINTQQISDLFAWAESIGAEIATTSDITWTDRNSSHTAQHNAGFEQLVQLYRHDRIQAHTVLDNPCEKSATESPCSVGQYSTFIQCTGDVMPCINWPYSAGNVLKERYIDIWRYSPVFNFARHLKWQQLTSCTTCGDAKSCSPCAGMNLRETGTVASPSPTVCNSTAAKTTALFGKTQQTRRNSRLRIVS